MALPGAATHSEFVKRVSNQFGPFLPDRGEKPWSRMRRRMKKPRTVRCVASHRPPYPGSFRPPWAD